jgi:serine/threonine protein kinase
MIPVGGGGAHALGGSSPHCDEESEWHPASPQSRLDLMQVTPCWKAYTETDVCVCGPPGENTLYKLTRHGVVVKPALLRHKLQKAQVQRWERLLNYHPNIVRWTWSDVLHMPVMHIVPGMSLIARMLMHDRRGTCVHDNTQRVMMQQIILGMAHLHAVQCPHGDLGPQNVMTALDGSVVLVDVDNAMLRVCSNSNESTGHTTSPSIMSPENARIYSPADPQATTVVTYAGDFWALGILLICMRHGPRVQLKNRGACALSVDTPFEGSNFIHLWFFGGFIDGYAPPQVVVALQEDVAPGETELPPVCDLPWVASVLLLCLQPNTKQRCDSASSLLEAVSADGGSLPTECSEAACRPNAVRQLFQ